MDQRQRQQGSPAPSGDQRIHRARNYSLRGEKSAGAKGAEVKLEGRIWKDTKTNYWVVCVPLLDISTQGRSRKEALAMIEDAIQIEIEKEGLRIRAELSREQGYFMVSANNPDSLIAFLLKRQRTCRGLSVRDVARRLTSSSPTAYAQYEQGKRAPSVGKLRELLHAIDPKLDAVLKAG
jgi:predicted RNase H-like HicB family nuclease